MICRLIEAEKGRHSVARLCRALRVSRSGYAWRARGVSERAASDKVLAARVAAIHAQSDGTYGTPRVHAELRFQGIRTSRRRVARLMAEQGLEGVSRRRRRRSTTTPSARPAAPDLVGRRFSAASGPDQVWFADITYVPTWEGWLYVALVVDAWSRRIVGWSMREGLEAELVVDALGMAATCRRPGAGAIHHSDRGAQLLVEGAEEELLAYMRFPREHWPKIRSTNPLERVNREIARRSDVVGIYPPTTPCFASRRGCWSRSTTSGSWPIANASTIFGRTLAESGLVASMGRRGSALDNAAAESAIASFKTELVHRRSFRSRNAAREEVFRWIEGWYNARRRHSALGYLSPADYEELHMNTNGPCGPADAGQPALLEGALASVGTHTEPSANLSTEVR